MKLKRYTAPDIRQAMTKVRDELGPDAVILSNRKIDNGIEIIAATDYDDAIVNGSTGNSRTEEVDLIKSGNAKKLADQLSKTFDVEKKESAWKKALTETYALDDEPEPIEKKPEKIKKNTSQVSNEWINRFNSSLEDEKEITPKSNSSNSPTDDAELKNVWDELSNLRGLLETQLSSLAWSDASKRNPQKSKVLKHLLELGLTPEMGYSLLSKIDDKLGFESSWRKALAQFASQLPVVEEDVIKQGGIFALVGPTGVGKTTTIAKMAARYALSHGTKGIALVTTDNYRIGAQEQLRTYGRILGTPVKVANDSEELRKVLKSLYDKDLVLIDTAGMSQRDIRLTEQFSMLSEGSNLIKTFLVMSASSQQNVLEETVQAYKKAFLDGCILTKLDESIVLGGALSTIVKNQIPIVYTSDGQRVPEDLHKPEAVNLLKKAVEMMNESKIKLDESVIELAFGGLAANDLT